MKTTSTSQDRFDNNRDIVIEETAKPKTKPVPKPVPVQAPKTKAEIVAELDACRDTFVQHVASTIEAHKPRRDSFVADIAASTPGTLDLGRILGWSEMVVSGEQEILVLQSSVCTLSTLTTYDSVLCQLKCMLNEWQSTSEMSFGRSSSAFSNAVDMARHQGMIEAIRTMRTWIRGMERRVEMLKTLPD